MNNLIDWNKSSEKVSIIDHTKTMYKHLKYQATIHTPNLNYMFVSNPDSDLTKNQQFDLLMYNLENNIPHDIENGFMTPM